MIDKDTIRKSYKRGIIKLIKDPNAAHGTAAMIGDDIFFFDAERAEKYDPLMYKKIVDEEEIVSAMYEAFTEFREEMPEQYSIWREAMK